MKIFPGKLLPVLGLAAAITAGSESTARAEQLTGAGATFPAPLYQRWFAEYHRLNPDTEINYQALGSGAGVKQFIQGTVAFGASDAAMSEDEIKEVKAGVVLLPVTAGSIVLIYNLPDLKVPLKLSRGAYADIFLGKIKKWNDPAIASANPGVTLPNLPIAVVRRADGSGTTYVFTRHLAAINKEWDDKVGFDKVVQWPVGLGAKGNDGVTAAVKSQPGAIGYVEYGYATENKLAMADLENGAGKFVAPTPESGSAALAQAELPENLIAWISDPKGDESYPIVTFTWILAYRKYDKPQTAETLKKVFEWTLGDGQKIAPSLGYLPLPAPVLEKVRAALATIE